MAEPHQVASVEQGSEAAHAEPNFYGVYGRVAAFHEELQGQIG